MLTLLTYCFYALVILIPMFLYLRSMKRREARAREAAK